MPAKKKDGKTAIKFTTRANPFPTAEGAGKRFGTVIPNGTMNQEELIGRMMARGCKLDRTTIRYFLDQLMHTVRDEIAERPCVIDIGFCKLRPVIRGSFESEDGEFDKKRHKLEIEAVMSPTIRNAVAEGLDPVNVTPTETPKPCIDSVCCEPDFARNVISASELFEVHGTGLTVRHGDESAELEFSSGGKLAVALTVQQPTDGTRRVKARLAEPLPTPLPRSARLILRTHGFGGALSPLMTVKSASIRLKR